MRRAGVLMSNKQLCPEGEETLTPSLFSLASERAAEVTAKLWAEPPLRAPFWRRQDEGWSQQGAQMSCDLFLLPEEVEVPVWRAQTSI